MVEEGLQDATKKYNFKTSDNYLKVLAEAHAKNGDLYKTWEIICKLRTMGINLSPFSFMFCLTNLGHSKEGLKAFTELAEARKNEGLIPPKTVISYFISLCRELDDVEGIERWMREKRELNYEFTPKDFMHLIRLYLNRREYDKAEEVFQTMQSDIKLDALFYYQFIQQYTHHGLVEKAIHWIEEAQKNNFEVDKTRSYTFIIEGFVEKNEMEKAEEWKQKAIKKEAKIYAEEGYARGYYKRGEIDKAENILKSIELAQTDIYSLLWKYYKESGNLEKAEQMTIKVNQQKQCLEEELKNNNNNNKNKQKQQ